MGTVDQAGGREGERGATMAGVDEEAGVRSVIGKRRWMVRGVKQCS
jgi:hypothetical protein